MVRKRKYAGIVPPWASCRGKKKKGKKMIPSLFHHVTIQSQTDRSMQMLHDLEALDLAVTLLVQNQGVSRHSCFKDHVCRLIF